MFGLQMFNEMEKRQREMDQLFSGLGLRVVPEKNGERLPFKAEDKGTTYRIEAALPGIDVEKMEINVLGRQLSLSAERAQAETSEETVWLRRERKVGRFSKSFTLPEDIDSEKVEAEYSNGVLVITLPKAASVLPKKIEVQAA